MGKRSNFERVERDFYPTPYEAVKPLCTVFPQPITYYEPCVGNRDLVKHLTTFGYICMGESDIAQDATITQYGDWGHEYFITNPPWDRKILHPLIHNLRLQRPTWLLFDADWMHTKQSSEFMEFCRTILSVGRVKWIPDSKMTGKDNCCWYEFVPWRIRSDTVFIGR